MTGWNVEILETTTTKQNNNKIENKDNSIENQRVAQIKQRQWHCQNQNLVF